MKLLRLAIYLLTAIVGGLGARAAEPTAAATPAAPLKVLLVGDSTMCEYSPMSPRWGWGQALPMFFKKGTVKVINAAQDGTSSKSFLAQGFWTKALAAQPDIVLIQFGHNDSRDPSDPRSTDAATDFRVNLRKFIDTAREAGAKPILVTPMRHTVLRNGDVRDDLPPYAQAMKAVALETKTPIIDLYASSTRLFVSLGEEGLARFRSQRDDTFHFNDQGAKALARLVANDLPKVDSRLAAVVTYPAPKPAP
jgi:lysophospholipase L1-like esterase